MKKIRMMKGKVMTMMIIIMMLTMIKDPLIRTKQLGRMMMRMKKENKERNLLPTRTMMSVFEGKYASTLQEKVRSLRANNTLMLAQTLF